MGGQGSGGHNRLDPAEHARRSKSGGSTWAEAGVTGGSGPGRLAVRAVRERHRHRASLCVRSTSSPQPTDSWRRDYCRAWAVRERLRQRRINEEGRVEAWLWRISQRLATLATTVTRRSGRPGVYAGIRPKRCCASSSPRCAGCARTCASGGQPRRSVVTTGPS